MNPGDRQPYNHGQRGGNVGVDKSNGGHAIRRQRASGIEPKPTEPEKPRPQSYKSNVVSPELMFPTVTPPCENKAEQVLLPGFRCML